MRDRGRYENRSPGRRWDDDYRRGGNRRRVSPPRRRLSPEPASYRAGSSRRNDEDRFDRRRSPSLRRQRRREPSLPREPVRSSVVAADKAVKKRTKPTANGGTSLRIDRHECRKAAIEFLINYYGVSDKVVGGNGVSSDSDDHAALHESIRTYIQSLDMDVEYYAFTVEILKGLLEDRKYTIIADRWVMGILDEHLQAELRVPDLSILRVAGYELLTHPEIPTTVIINEVNVLAKMYCPEKQSLIHAAVNRMIETQISIGNELAAESGLKLVGLSGAALKKKPNDPMAPLIGLDQEAQLALIILEQRRRKRKKASKYADESTSSSSGEEDEGNYSSGDEAVQAPTLKDTTEETMTIQPTVPRGAALGGFKIKYAKIAQLPKVMVNACTQTVRDPLKEPGIRVYRIQ